MPQLFKKLGQRVKTDVFGSEAPHQSSLMGGVSAIEELAGTIIER